MRRRGERKKEDFTAITILKETVERLKDLGMKRETYDNILDKLIKSYEQNIQIQNISK